MISHVKLDTVDNSIFYLRTPDRKFEFAVSDLANFSVGNDQFEPSMVGRFAVVLLEWPLLKGMFLEMLIFELQNIKYFVSFWGLFL